MSIINDHIRYFELAFKKLNNIQGILDVSGEEINASKIYDDKYQVQLHLGKYYKILNKKAASNTRNFIFMKEESKMNIF